MPLNTVLADCYVNMPHVLCDGCAFQLDGGK